MSFTIAARFEGCEIFLLGPKLTYNVLDMHVLHLLLVVVCDIHTLWIGSPLSYYLNYGCSHRVNLDMSFTCTPGVCASGANNVMFNHTRVARVAS